MVRFWQEQFLVTLLRQEGAVQLVVTLVWLLTVPLPRLLFVLLVV